MAKHDGRGTISGDLDSEEVEKIEAEKEGSK